MTIESQDQKSSRIMVVDDDPKSIKLIAAYLLPEGHEILTAGDGLEALSKLEKEDVDLILLDVMMPNLNGYEVCKQIKDSKELRIIPVVMMTALSDKQDRIKGIEAGTDEFLTKPIDREELLARVRSLIKVKDLNTQLEDAENVLFALVNMIEAKDSYTIGHSQRVTQLAIRIAEEMRLSGRAKELLKKAGILHDLGKVAISEAILNKPSTLTKEEYDQIKKHPVIAEEICAPLKSMKEILPVIRHHHERFDGAGYPDGIKEEKIPLESRILAIADSYDAMSSDRPYRDKVPKDEIIKRLKQGAGSQWDPKIMELFLNIIS
ncbi:MAG: HD domain-containing phosphohydrolase [bacterium]